MDTKPQIKILDAVHCKANAKARKLILPCLTVKIATREKTKYGTVPGTGTKSLITGYNGSAGIFLTGFLPKIKKYCKKNEIKIKIKGMEEKIVPETKSPKLKGITFRNNQIKAIKKACRKGRGQIVFPTGSGKTIIALGLFLCFKSSVRLFLCHTNDIYDQTIAELKKYKLKHYEITTKSNWDEIKKKKSCILISKVQSFARINIDNYIDFIDMVIVDEVHHVNKEDSQYGKILKHMLAPIRIGLTATIDPNKLKALIAEGLFGPIIYELSIKEGVELGQIVKPKINLEAVPYDIRINKKGNYKFKDLYKYGIVENRARNRIIANIAKEEVDKNNIVLILIEKIEHGERIKKALARKNIKAPFVHGGTKREIRTEVKNKLINKKINIAIASRVWKEGINIPSLNHIINAAGYKDEKGVLQALGRGLRPDKNKSMITLTDFCDPYRFLAEHSIFRIQIYIQKGWL